MVKACELKRGHVVQMGDAPHIVEDIQVQTPSARGGATLYKMRFRNVRTKQKVDKSFRGDDALQEADFVRREVQFLYSDPSGYTFMDLEDYSQFTLSDSDAEDARPYLELPPVVELEITETGPAVKGASATARTKPATLVTGLTVQVPEYMESNTVIRVDTRSGAFLSRA